MRGVQRRHRGGHLRHVLAEPRPQRAVVGLELPAAQLVGVGDEAHLAHVELVEHQSRGSARSPPARPAPATITASASGWRTLIFACARAERPSSTASRATSICHSSFSSRSPASRPVAQVHRRLAAVEVVVDLVGRERDQRGQQLRHRHQAGVQRPEGGRIAVPEAPARAAHVPVGQLVHERRQRAACARRVVVVQPLGRDFGGRRQARQRPAVQVGQSLGRGVDVVDVRVQDVEAVGVPEREHELAHRLADRLQREAVAVPRLLRGEVVPAERIGAVGVEHLPGRDHVALGLAHLLALGIEDQAEAEARLVGASAEQQRRDRRASSRTSRASGRAPRRCSRPGGALWSPDWAKGIEPESHQTSISSGTRRKVLPSRSKVTSSM